MKLYLTTLFCAANCCWFWLVGVNDCIAQQMPIPNAPNGRGALTYKLTDESSQPTPPPTVLSTAQGLNFSDQASWQPPASDPIASELYDSPAIHQSTFENMNRRVQSGFPYSLSKRASFTYNDRYQGYYVGGGVPTGWRKGKSRGEPRYDNEGTWGVDYAPFYSRVVSNWSHGRLFQGGTGQYEPDHKNRPFGLTFGKHFGNKDRKYESEHPESHADHHAHTSDDSDDSDDSHGEHGHVFDIQSHESSGEQGQSSHDAHVGDQH